MITKKVKEKRRYFTQETDDAIIEYNSTEDFRRKNRIYEEKIYYAFFKLTQNIIHTFKFYHTDVDDLEHLQHEIIVFLNTKLPLFHHSNNIQDRLVKIITKEFGEEYDRDFREFTQNSPQVTQEQINEFISKLNVSQECMSKLMKLTPPKGYSYFGTITKRWLIIHNDKIYKKKIEKSSTDDLEKDESHSYTLDSSSSNDKLYFFIDQYIDFISENVYNIFPKGNDAQIADAVLELFRKRDHIDIFHKKALYLYVHEIVPEAKTPKITKIVDVLKKIFEINYIFYLENDYLDFENCTSKYL